MDAYYNLFKCLCRPDSYEEFPDLKIQIDNNVYTLPKESYIIAVKIVFFIFLGKRNLLFLDYEHEIQARVQYVGPWR